MDYSEFASDLPLDRTFKFTSVEENEEIIQRWGVNQVMRQTGRGKFRSDLAVRSTEQADLYADRFNKAISMYLESPPGTVGILFPRSASGQFLASGQNLANNSLLVFPDAAGADIVIPDLAGSEAISIPNERFIELCEVLSPSFVRPESITVFEGNTKRLNHLRQAVLKLVAHPELEANDEQISNLLAATIAWITDCPNHGWRQSDELHTHKARRRIAKLAQVYIEEYYRETVRIEDLCRITAVGVRTLQRYFREYFGLTITDYLKTVRLNAAHRELIVATPTEASVTNIALQNGFTHLGRFSTEFHQRFGDLPKDVLAIRAGQKS